MSQMSRSLQILQPKNSNYTIKELELSAPPNCIYIINIRTHIASQIICISPQL